jgi:hypothetical protein
MKNIPFLYWFVFQRAIDSAMSDRERRQRESDCACVLSEHESSDQSTHSMTRQILQYAKHREARIEQFLQHVNSKRLCYFEELVSRHKTTGVWRGKLSLNLRLCSLQSCSQIVLFCPDDSKTAVIHFQNDRIRRPFQCIQKFSMTWI